MKPLILISLLGFCFSILSACTSEYEECLKEGRTLKARLSGLTSNDLMYSEEISSLEAKEIYQEINLLAKVSGNEQLFLKEVFGH